MLFEVRMVRGEGASREERTVTVEADGATTAYVAAMKSSNASEMWTPVGWKEAGGQGGAAGVSRNPPEREADVRRRPGNGREVQETRFGAKRRSKEVAP